MEAIYALAIGVLTASGVWLRAAPPHLPGHHGTFSAVVRGQSVHLRNGATDDRRRANHRNRGAGRSFLV